MMKKFFILPVLGSIFIFSCKKSDSVCVHAFSGHVTNLCTDSGLANCEVGIWENNNSISL